MIKVNKGSEPPLLQTEKVNFAIKHCETFYTTLYSPQVRYNWLHYKEIDEELKILLYNIFNKKCGYCESLIPDSNAAYIDRYRPHTGAMINSKYYPQLYWWLSLNWDNLTCICAVCASYKANFFPITGTVAKDPQHPIHSEEPLLINPCIDTPEKHLSYSSKGYITYKSARGKQTLDLLRLNRQPLISERKRIIDETISKIYNISREHIIPLDEKNEKLFYEKIGLDHSDSFLAVRKWAISYSFRKEKEEKRGIIIDTIGPRKPLKIPRIKNSKNIILPTVKNNYFPIEYIEIKNFKRISYLKIDFNEDTPQSKSWLFLLGENGVGKSSILQAIALGLKLPIEELPKKRLLSLIKKGETTAEIKIKERDQDNIIITNISSTIDNTIHQVSTFSGFLVGYGSFRLPGETVDDSNPDTRSIAYDNLFNTTKPLADISKWLAKIHQSNRDLFDKVAITIKKLLPEEYSNDTLTMLDGQLSFTSTNQQFDELSDGYKSTIHLAVDIMMKLSSENADMDKISGVVLVDELGNQLHPQWQMRIITQLRSAFPNINFIISTHHPLCLRGSKKGEVLLLKLENKEVIPFTELPDPSCLRVDQILGSEFFGLKSLIDPIIEADFNKYYALLANQKNLTSEEQATFSDLKDRLRDKQQFGSTLREELMYTVIDELLAQKVTTSKEALKKEVVQRVAKIWEKLKTNSE